MQRCSIDIWFVPKLLLYYFSVAKLKKKQHKKYLFAVMPWETLQKVSMFLVALITYISYKEENKHIFVVTENLNVFFEC